MKTVIKKIEKIIWDLLHWGRKLYWRTFKIKTFGARVLLYKEGKVFLQKNKYGNLWVFPGGGMKAGEDPYVAGKRELYEESNIKALEFDRILGKYRNTREGRNDTVVIVIIKKWADHGRKANFEIEDSNWFGVDELPETTSGATRRRIEEFLRNEIEEIRGNW
ncbi:MAG: 8-oxo-dGTP pyrophosphatase MutT (NUDIX family) [Candidatus Paceibacteria bacterium]|jgi:8-oxo-dGTP pyrophosphatase MutT (NUDIX family)